MSTDDRQPDENELLDASLDDLLDEAIDASTTAPVPEGFADRVLEARVAEVTEAAEGPGALGHDVALGDRFSTAESSTAESSTAESSTMGPSGRMARFARRHPALTPALAAAAAALMLVASDQVPELLPAEGRALISERTSVDLAGRGIAVAEPGSDLSWERSSGSMAVQQRKGNVFYRVEGGRPFVVETPAGRVTVTGTCFSVEVLDMSTTSKIPGHLSYKSPAFTAFLGATISAAVVVGVYEGSVEMETAGEAVTLSAGEQAVGSPESAPSRLPDLERVKRAHDNTVAERDQLKVQVGDLERQLKTYMLAAANGTDPLAAENERLKAELDEMRGVLSVEKQIRSEQEGRPFDFPEDLPDAYRQDALQSAVSQALAASGLVGEITSVDCTEFPCMVQGETLAPGNTDETSAEIDRGHRSMQRAIHEQYPENENSYSNSSWGDVRVERDGKEYRLRNFSAAIYPKDTVTKDNKADFRRRMRWRLDQLREASPMDE